MEDWEIRRNNLCLLIDRFGSIKRLNIALGRKAKDSVFSQIKNKRPQNSAGEPRTMGDGIARKIENRLNLPGGWMDKVHSAKEIDNLITSVAPEEKSIKLISGGDGIRANDKRFLDPYEIFMKPNGNYKNEKNIVAFIIQNNTIKDIAPLGSVVLVDTSVHNFNGDGIYLFKIFDQLVWRQITFSLDGVFSIKKDATDSQVYQSLENFTIAGKAFYVWKGSPL